MTTIGAKSVEIEIVIAQNVRKQFLGAVVRTETEKAVAVFARTLPAVLYGFQSKVFVFKRKTEIEFKRFFRPEHHVQVLRAVLVVTNGLYMLQITKCAPVMKKQLQILFVEFSLLGGYSEMIAVPVGKACV